MIYSFCDWFIDICYVLLMFNNVYFLILEIDEDRDSVGFINVLYDCLLVKFMDLIFFFWGVMLGICILLNSFLMFFLLNWLVLIIGGIGFDVFGIGLIMVWKLDEISGLFFNLVRDR